MKKLNSNSKKRNLDYNGVGSGGGVTPEVIEQLEQDVERALLGNHVYSTTERVAGEWIDGRNIYEKTNVYDSTIHMSTTWTSLSTLGFNDVDIVINARGYNTDSAVAEYSELKYDATNGLRCHDGGLDVNVVVVQFLKDE